VDSIHAAKNMILPVNNNSFPPNTVYGSAPVPNTTIPVKDFLTFYYGRTTPYAVSYREFGDLWNDTLIPQIIAAGFASGQTSANPSLFFNNDSDYNAALDVFKSRSGVFDKFINDIYSANSANNPDGTIGSGLLYTFSNNITLGGQTININSLPPYVLAKLSHQNTFLDASNAYSGISRANIQSLARNGVLYDTGKQPEITLNRLFEIYTTGQVPAVNDFGISAAVIAAIAAAVIGIIGAIAGAVAAANKAETEARTIDSSLADTSRLSALGNSLMPEGGDFNPSSTFGPGGTGGSGFDWRDMRDRNNNNNSSTSSILPIAAAGAALYLFNKNKKK
jgi:hypothetical protein